MSGIAAGLLPATRNALSLLLLSMADDETVIGWSDSEWTGIAPLLEEDVAMSSLAQDELGHSVHPEVTGLEPDRPYWYRFRAGTHISPVGRTRTTPLATSSPRTMRFAFASCQAWQDGHFTAYDHMAREDLDLVVHLGDYIYERGITTNVRGVTLPSVFRREASNLARYRLRYSLYKSDAALQRAHAAFPWVHTVDDHEVEVGLGRLEVQGGGTADGAGTDDEDRAHEMSACC